MSSPLSTQHNAYTSLYEQDYVCWLETMADLLRQGNLSELDTMNLAEEVEDMGKRDKRAVESNAEVVLMHLLKYRYQPDLRSNSWRFTILEHRDRLDRLFRDSPSLKSHLAANIDDCYARARKKAAVETDLPIDDFPSSSPFALDDILNADFLPEDESSL